MRIAAAGRAVVGAGPVERAEAVAEQGPDPAARLIIARSSAWLAIVVGDRRSALEKASAESSECSTSHRAVDTAAARETR
jgi:hypothetical protein